jgi:hypothetical protein
MRIVSSQLMLVPLVPEQCGRWPNIGGKDFLALKAVVARTMGNTNPCADKASG